MSPPLVRGTAHIIAQRGFHDPAFIVGDHNGLTQIRDAINTALEEGSARGRTFAADGEGYSVYVLCVTDAEMADVPYGYTDTEICGLPGPWTNAMIRIVR